MRYRQRALLRHARHAPKRMLIARMRAQAINRERRARAETAAPNCGLIAGVIIGRHWYHYGGRGGGGGGSGRPFLFPFLYRMRGSAARAGPKEKTSPQLRARRRARATARLTICANNIAPGQKLKKKKKKKKKKKS